MTVDPWFVFFNSNSANQQPSNSNRRQTIGYKYRPWRPPNRILASSPLLHLLIRTLTIGKHSLIWLPTSQVSRSTRVRIHHPIMPHFCHVRRLVWTFWILNWFLEWNFKVWTSRIQSNRVKVKYIKNLGEII